MLFDVAGPFEISQHTSKKNITKESIADLKGVIEGYETGLSTACGCYVVARRAGRGYTPLYVGQACKSSILNEALNPSNREKYNNELARKRGTPILFLIPMRTPQGKFRKNPQHASGLPALDFLERWLIACAISKNPKLINNKETKFLRQIRVTGILNAEIGESTSASTALRRTLGS